MTARVREVLAVAAFACAITAVLACSVLRAPSERVFGMATAGFHHDPFTAMRQFERPIAAGIQLQPVTDVPGALLARVAGPVAAYNWIVLLTFPLSAAAAYALARHLALSRAGALVAALAFAFSPFHLAHAAYHPHIAQTQWLPLYLLALWRSLDRPSPGALLLLMLAIAAVTLSNFYGGLIAAVLTVPAAGAYWFFHSDRGPRARRALALTSAMLLVSAGGGAAYVWQTAPDVVFRTEAFATLRADLLRYGAHWWSYLVPPVAHPLTGDAMRSFWTAAGVDAGLIEQQVALGWGVMALGAVALSAWVIQGRGTPSLPAVPILAIVAVAAFVCSLAPAQLEGPFTFMRPSALIFLVAPMFRAYARFGFVVQLMAAVLAGIGAERLWRSGRRAPRAICIALLAGAVAEYAVWPPWLSRPVLPTASHRWAAAHSGNVRVLDCVAPTAAAASVAWLTRDRISARAETVDDCGEPNLADRLQAGGYTHLLVRNETAEGRWMIARRPPEGLVPAASFSDSRIFALAGLGPPVYTAGMTAFYPREHDAEWTWRWMGPGAAWKIVNRSAERQIAHVDVEMMAFERARDLTIVLDGRAVQSLRVSRERATIRIGPLPLSPGPHALAFETPHDGAAAAGRTDGRPLSFRVGTWRWTVKGEAP
ncbi:MAG: YfhO family protein [Acidobacteriota bacterium]|nr:YfhO family protein [Acidobacteriota bacterium]